MNNKIIFYGLKRSLFYTLTPPEPPNLWIYPIKWGKPTARSIDVTGLPKNLEKSGGGPNNWSKMLALARTCNSQKGSKKRTNAIF